MSLNAIYLLNQDYQNIDFRENLFSNLKKFHPNFELFFPIAQSNENAKFSLLKEEVLSNLEPNFNFISKIITNFENFSDKFVVIVGLIDELDYEISKSLQAPFILSENSKFKQAIIQKHNSTSYVFNGNLEEILNQNFDITTPFMIENILLKRAKKSLKTIVLPESEDERILKASHIILQNNGANLILLGDENLILSRASELNLDLTKAKFINLENNDFNEDFAQTLYELRKSKGLSLEEAKDLIKDRNYFGTMLVYKGIAHGMVSGAASTTADTIRPALQFIKTKPGVKSVSGAFLVSLDTKFQFFADCAINPNPSAEELAGIALTTANTASSFGLNPKVAMLSYSTGDSGSGSSVDLVLEATNLAKKMDQNLIIDGPIQFDAATSKSVCEKKMPNSMTKGEANVFIFPDLNCGNICYKAVQRSANALAIGPILQGLNKPINDLSRGCLVKDIVNTILITSIQG